MATFDRLAIINSVVSVARKSENVLALWECGSAAFGRTDAFSDIDLEGVVSAGNTEAVALELKAAIAEIAKVTVESRLKGDRSTQWFWQLNGAPVYNYIDLSLYEADPAGVTIDTGIHNPPVIHFDKCGCLHLIEESEEQRFGRVSTAVTATAACCAFHPVLVEKHIRRGNVLQAYGEYQRSMIRPLIELLRIKHCPQRSSWHTTYISWDLPSEVNERLEPLVMVGGPDDMMRNLPIITAWKQGLIEELQRDQPTAHHHSDQRDCGRERHSFDTVAKVYDAYRPGYPAALVEAIVTEAKISRDSAVLEVGSGTGQATEPLAALGCSILCVEPGENLVAVARSKFASHGRVTFTCSTFEDWPLMPAAFDLVFSAQAFHWVRRDIGAAKAADALKLGGHLALFWNLYPGMTGPLADDMQRVYDSVVPELAARTVPKACLEKTIADRLAIVQEANRQRPRYGPVQILRLAWSQPYTTVQYMGLLNTYSDHICLDAPVRARLLEGIAAAIDAHGGIIDRPYVSVLYLAQKLRT